LCDLFDDLGPDAPALAGLKSTVPPIPMSSSCTTRTCADAEPLGAPGELLLYLFGRQEHARVEVDGPRAAVDALAATTLSW
jgi:hypothetical protein